MMRIGRQVGGAAAAGLGAFILLWGDFATPWESVPVAPPLRAPLADLTGAVMLGAGVALIWGRRGRPAALALGAVFAIFTLLWARVVAGGPLVYDSWGNVAEESSVAAGYVALFASLAPQRTDNTARLAIAARLWFGVCSVSFGVVHFESFAGCASFVPHWVPLGGAFWTAATGAAHLAVALALLSGVWALTAARLAAIMYLGFGLIGWGAVIAGHPADHFAWGGEVITVTLAAAAWMVGDCVAAFPPMDGALFMRRRDAQSPGR